MSPEEDILLGWFVFTAFWAFMSTVALATMVYEERSRWAAWFWAASFVACSLTAAYFFGRLL